MKKAIAISFLFVFLFANTELRQLFMLPTLIEHYQEHKKENSSETFWHYLSQHYVNKISHSHNDNHRDHERLPFKTNDFGTTNLSVIALSNPQISILTPNIFVNKDFTIYNEDIDFSAFHGNIWQPPKIG